MKPLAIDTPMRNQMGIVSVIIMRMKKSIIILRKDLKNMSFKSSEDKDWLKKLEKDNKVLK